LDAEELFALGDVGVVPLIPLTRSTQSVEDLLARCRSEIVQKAPPDKQLELLIVSRILAGHRYNNQQGSLDVLLEERMLTESPEITRLMNKSKAEGKLEELKNAILAILQERFAETPDEVSLNLERMTDMDRLRELQRLAIRCADLEEFKSQAAFST
jgi:hypothetical protein